MVVFTPGEWLMFGEKSRGAGRFGGGSEEVWVFFLFFII